MKQFVFILIAALAPALSWAAATPSATAKEAMPLIQNQKAILIDVREDSEVKDGKVKDARVFPTSKMGTPDWEQFVSSLPKDKEIFTYCARGRRAEKVAEALRAKGFKARSAGGFQEWVQSGAKSSP